MSSIVYRTDEKTGNKYAYESRSFRDPVTKKVKTKKTYLGRVDPLTDEIIPKAEPGKRNRQPSTRQIQQVSEETSKQISALTDEVSTLKTKVSTLNAQLEKKEKFVQAILKVSAQYQADTMPGKPSGKE